MKKLKIVSVLLALVLAFSLSVPAAAAYPDLDGHWAAPYMNDLAARGYLSGYADGTMRPNANMTAAETLVMLSRFYAPKDNETTLMRADYFDFVVTNVPATLYWAYNNLIVCLGAGIVTENEIKSMNLGAEIQKEQLAVFLVRAMQMTTQAAALSGTTLTFADANKISAGCYGSVAQLYAIKIVTGDDFNNFAPQSSVTRAVVATMVSRALDYLEDNNKTLVLNDYAGVTRTEGIIRSVGAGAVEIRGFDGLTREYPVPAAAEVTVNGTPKALSTLYNGCYTGISIKNGAISKLTIDSTSGVQWVQGAINSVSNVASETQVRIRNLETGAVTSHTIGSNTTIYKDGSVVGTYALNYDDFISLKLENKNGVKAIIASGKYELSGTVSSIEYGSTVVMQIVDGNGIKYRFVMNIAALPQILRGSTTISIDRLKAGNAVTVRVDDCKVDRITVTGTEDTLSGELTSITATKTGTIWVITKADGTTVSLKLDENAGAYSGTKAILLSDIKVGDQVAVVVYGETITEVHVKSGVSSSDKVTGTILAVDFSKKTITLLTPDNKLVYLNTETIVSVIYARTGASISIMALEPDVNIVAYGAYRDATHFNPTSIIIE